MLGGRPGVALILALGLVLACDGELGGSWAPGPHARGSHRAAPGVLRLRGAGKSAGTKKLAFKTPGVGPRCRTQSSIRLREMAKYPHDAEIAKRGCGLLWRVCVNGEKQKRVGNFKGACKALIQVLQIHWKVEEVMEEALCLACNLCFAQPNNPMGFRGWSHLKNQEEIGRMGGARLMVNTVKQHDTAERVVLLGTRALANLAYNNTQNAESVVRWEGIETVLRAMRMHKHSMVVQEAGCIFLWSCLLTVQNETHITYGYEYTGAPAGGTGEVDLRIAGKIASEGGVDDVMDALRMYHNDTEEEGNAISVAEQACAALWYMARVPGRLQETVKSIPDIVPVLKNTIRANRKVSPPAATWAARMLELVTGRNCSKWMMPIKMEQLKSKPLKKKKKGRDLQFSKLDQDLEGVDEKREKKRAKNRRKGGGGNEVVLDGGGEEEEDDLSDEDGVSEGMDSDGSDNDEDVKLMHRAQAAEERKKWKATEGKKLKKREQIKKQRQAYEKQVHENKGKSTYQLMQESYDKGVRPSKEYENPDENLLPTPLI